MTDRHDSNLTETGITRDGRKIFTIMLEDESHIALFRKSQLATYEAEAKGLKITDDHVERIDDTWVCTLIFEEREVD